MSVLVNGTDLGLLSDGTLRVAEILTWLLFPELKLLLIEEPETAVHPGLLAKLLAEFDAYSSDRQLVLSTQAPQVVSWADPQAIRLVERRFGHTEVRSLRDDEVARLSAYLNDEGTLGDFVYSGLSMADLAIGVLAEDENDCDVIRVLCRRILLEGRGIGPSAWRLDRRFGKGCTRLRRKATSWLVELARQGCHAAIIMHDLDRNPSNGSLNELAVLERELNAIPVPHGLIRHICIPVEEIEAWFFSSEKVLARVCGKPQKAYPPPHLIPRPKEKLIAMSRGAHRRPRYSQNDNSKLAEELDLAECAKRCPAFGVLNRFVLGLFNARQN